MVEGYKVMPWRSGMILSEYFQECLKRKWEEENGGKPLTKLESSRKFIDHVARTYTLPYRACVPQKVD